MKLILASGSERRKELLSWLEIPFEVVESGVDETVYPDEEVSEVVARLAALKARQVAAQSQEALVIGSDTMVCVGNQIIGKPADRKEAEKFIRMLMGKTHEVWTGVCIIDTDLEEQRIEVEKTLVKIRKLSEEQLKKYLDSGEWEGKAGAYMIQGMMGKFVENIEGSFTNVVGLPLELVQDMLESMGAFVEVDLRKVVMEKTGYEK